MPSLLPPLLLPPHPPLVPRSCYVAINRKRHKLLLDRDPVEGRDLDSQPDAAAFREWSRSERTLSDGRSLGGQPNAASRQAIAAPGLSGDDYLDPTCDPTHVAQQLSFFNGHYDNWRYLPVLGFVSFNSEVEPYSPTQSQ